ncbi:MAG TPA: DUF167 domain-containing protein [Coriobacteriia bacterium]|nr:DUF167 domain-containing protein [Coriobacteriia bacterium]
MRTISTSRKSTRAPCCLRTLAELTLSIKVTPRADRDAVVGWLSEARDELAVRVCAAPDDGKANQAVIKTLSKSLGVPKSAIRINRGFTSRQKLLAVDIGQEFFDSWKQGLPVKEVT